jgi:two-component system cell cycle response regulator
MSNYSILVVDDEPDNFEVIEALLPSADYNLHYASRGQEAIAGLDQFDPDVILLDVMMPGMDGFEVCQRIKAMPQWQHVPMIMVTALSSKADLARCLDIGADDFVSKPISALELRARIQSMLRIKKQHDRIQSLSKLQRNNIHTLENSLNELRLDLGVSFPQELKLSLQSILDQMERLQYNIDLMTPIEVNGILDLTNRSVMKLEKLHQDFLFYLELAVGKDPRKHQICAPKVLIEQIALVQVNRFKPSPQLVFDLEDIELAVTPNHVQHIVSELLERFLTTANLNLPIVIHGRNIDHSFHFWIDHRAENTSMETDSKLSELIQFNPSGNGERELGIGLKIVKKIVEIYDGLFLVANTEQDRTTIYLTLPLSPAVKVSQPLIDLSPKS